MALHIKERNDILYLKGNLNTSNIRSLSSYLMHLFETRSKVSVDLNQVQDINKEVARELFKLKKNAEAAHRVLTFFYATSNTAVDGKLLATKE